MICSYLGYTVESCLPLGAPLAASTASPVVRISECDSPRRPKVTEAPSLDIVLSGPGDEHVGYQVFREERFTLICIDRELEFSVSGESIQFWRRSGVSDATVLDYLGPAFCLCIEFLGCPVLHGSAVQSNDGAIVFVGESGAGKSTMASAFWAAGHEVLVDDASVIVPLGRRFGVRTAFDHLRLWPDSVTHFFGSPSDWPVVDPRAAKRRIRPAPSTPSRSVDEPLVAIIALDRQERRVTPVLQPLVGQQALRLLVAQSYCRQTVEAAGLQPRRLSVLAQIAATVPVLQLSYGGGLDALMSVPPMLEHLSAVESLA